MRKFLSITIIFLSVTIPFFALGHIDSNDVIKYLSGIDGLTIVSCEPQGMEKHIAYTGFYRGNNGDPKYEEVNNSPEILNIFNKLDYEVSIPAKVNDMLYVFSSENINVNKYSISTGELVYSYLQSETDFYPFHWKSANMFVYKIIKYIDNNAYFLLRFYDAKTYSFVCEKEISNLYDFGLQDLLGWIDYSDTEIITFNQHRNDTSIFLFDVFTGKVKRVLDLSPVIDMHNRACNLRKISDTEIEFVFSARSKEGDNWIVCRYDLTKSKMEKMN